MNRYLLLIAMMAIKVSALAQYTQYVNPFIGTTNYGATHPGPAYPHSMASIAPYNVAHGESLNAIEKDEGWNSRAYIYENKFLTGFSHINLSGVGCPDLGSILLMPTTGDLELNPAKYGTTYQNEAASPGFYGVELDNGVKVELTSTPRTGLSKYTFPEGKSHVILNLGKLSLTNETGASMRIVSETEIEGSKMIGNFCYTAEAVRPVYFVVRFSRPASNFGAWKKMPTYTGVEADWVKYHDKIKPYERFQHVISGDDIGSYFSFDTEEGEEIYVKVGISYTSIENARLNLETEQPAFAFDQTKMASEDKWNELLGRIKVESSNENDKTIFYSGLYHMLTHPNIIQDVNGDYPLMEQYGTGNTKGNRYTVFSLWDTYRNVHPFLSLVYPEIQSDMVNTMVDMYKESGWLPKWELYGMETHVMVGDPGTPVIADTYLRGIKDFDVEAGYEAIKKASETPEAENKLRKGIDRYNELGYVAEDTADIWGGGVSSSLEYYIADWNIAQLAKALNKTDDYKRFLSKSKGYKNLFDKSTGMLRPRYADGTWHSPFDPEYGKNFEAVVGYVEGNAWQYRFYVPHDIPGLIKLNGGKQKFAEQLQLCFDTDNYNVANEPDITYPFLFNYIPGQEWKSSEMVNNIIDKHYTNTPDGIPGNDDTGTLSAWLVYSMMGFYPVCPGDLDYALVAPQFDNIVIELNQNYYPGESITISSSSQKGKLKEVRFNNKPIKGFFLDHHEMTKGGQLEFIFE